MYSKSKSWTVVLLVVGLLFLLTANFALWLNGSIYDRKSFVRLTVGTIQRTEVRNAIAGATADAALGSIPAAQSVIGEPIEKAISGILASDRFKPVLTGLAEKLNILLTAREPKAVSVNIAPIKSLIGPIVGALGDRLGTSVKPSDIPSSIVLVKKGEIPTISGWAVPLLWAGPILGLVGLGIYIWLVWAVKSDDRPAVLKTAGGILAVGSLAFVILARVAKAPLLASVESTDAKVVVGSLFDAFVGNLNVQTWFLVAAGVVMVAIGYLLPWSWKRVAPEQQKRREAA